MRTGRQPKSDEIPGRDQIPKGFSYSMATHFPSLIKTDWKKRGSGVSPAVFPPTFGRTARRPLSSSPPAGRSNERKWARRRQSRGPGAEPPAVSTRVRGGPGAKFRSGLLRRRRAGRAQPGGLIKGDSEESSSEKKLPAGARGSAPSHLEKFTVRCRNSPGFSRENPTLFFFERLKCARIVLY